MEKQNSDIIKELNFYPDRNPNPVFTIGRKGELYYSNSAARRLLKNCGSKDDKIIYPEDFEKTASKAISLSKIQKLTIQVKQEHFSFSFCPRDNEEKADVYGVDISEEKKHQHYFSVISAFSMALLEAETEEDVAHTIAAEAIAKLDFVDCVVYLLDRKDGLMKQKAAYGPKNPKKLRDFIEDPISLNFGEGIVGMAATRMETVIVDDVTKESNYVLDDEQRMSEIAVPLIADNELIGVIDSEHPEKNHFTEEDAKILESIASIASSRIQRYRAMEETKRTEKKFRSFVENAFGGFYILRGEKFEYANDRFYQMTGYTSAELISSDFSLYDLILEADEKAHKAMEARYSGDNSPKSYNLKIKTKSGEASYLAINTCVLQDERGDFTLGIALDITESVQARKQLEEAVESLEKRTDELNEFAHLASHNLRAPVTNLSGLLGHYNLDDPMDPINRIIFEKFSVSVDQLNLTLEEMHRILRVRAKEEFDIRTVNLNELIQSVRLQLSEKISAKAFRIQTHFEVESVKYERSHLENLFLNLISNAIKYSRDGVISHIRISSSRTEDYVKLIFQDNGLGLDLEKHGKKMFGMYKRFHTNSDGRGLGLYLVKRQLSALGSHISVESEPGRGTRFTVLLVSK
jgi:PAS domain S-box-containing protein